MRLLLQNNLFLLATLDLQETEVIYAPIYYSELQHNFLRQRFEELKKIAPHLRWTEEIDEDEFDLALAWDALYEQNAFGKKLHPGQNRLFSSLPFDLPESFTPFRIKTEKYLPKFYAEAVFPWDSEVKSELDYYFRQKHLPLTYLDTRNELVSRDGSTKFSRYLSCGVLDVRYLYNEVRHFEELHGATKSTSWIIFELLWREYFYWHYQKFPRQYFSKDGLKGPLDFSDVPDYPLESNIPFFRAALRELTETGFLSNRARQIFASIWINDLGFDWRSGARLFEEHLLDYDVYSNYGNWMYLAGVGVDPRGKRYFNVEKQLEMYDPQGEYLKSWL
jgi:deoxyribodipyrimidine photo-lyase